MAVPCLSARFVGPFAQTLADYETFDRASLRRLEAIDPEGRIPIRMASELAIHQVAKTGDADLGLRAARAMPLGRAGALDYAIRSAATLRQAIETGARYASLFNDAFEVGLEVAGTLAAVRVECCAPVPRAIHDFAMSAWYANHFRGPLGDDARLECWFSHPRPQRTGGYDSAFREGRLRFEAPFYGFAFDAGRLDARLPTADASLHRMLCEHLAVSLTHLSARRNVTARVRDIVMRDLAQGSPSAAAVARQLHMSHRTLGRRLEREKTSFSAVVDELRRDLALRYIDAHDVTLAEVSAHLGFAHVEAFHRAFRRWTGRTPGAYRRASGRVPADAVRSWHAG